MKKITRKWLINSFGIILIIVLAMIGIVAVVVRNYYYSSVQQYISSQASSIDTSIDSIYSQSPNDVTSEIVSLVENFSAKNRMELMAVTDSTTVLITSSGFEPDHSVTMPDYINAIESGTNYGTYIGDIEQEYVYAVTYLYNLPGSDINTFAMRYIVSLTNINNQIILSIGYAALLGLAIIFFVILSSSYFVNSLIKPISDIGDSTKKIAQGDFDVRLDISRNDEIGELCGAINEMAEGLSNSEQIKNDFISSVSHELRTPLTAIRGWGETILNSAELDEVTTKKGVSIMINETQRLSTMVEELLDFSRMQSGRMNLEFSKIDVIAELSDAVLMFTQRAQLENKQINYDEPDFFAPVRGDRNRLRQVFVNVLDNSLKYSDSGDSVSIDITLSDNAVTVSVADTGVGISSEDLPNVTQKFYKGNTTRRGSGIGLAVAKEIILMHDGELDINSEKNVGTSVTITLPLIL